MLKSLQCFLLSSHRTFSQLFEAHLSEGSQQVTVSGVRPGACYRLVVARNGSVLLNETLKLGEKAARSPQSRQSCSNFPGFSLRAKLGRRFQ